MEVSIFTIDTFSRKSVAELNHAKGCPNNRSMHAVRSACMLLRSEQSRLGRPRSPPSVDDLLKFTMNFSRRVTSTEVKVQLSQIVIASCFIARFDITAGLFSSAWHHRFTIKNRFYNKKIKISYFQREFYSLSALNFSSSRDRLITKISFGLKFSVYSVQTVDAHSLCAYNGISLLWGHFWRICASNIIIKHMRSSVKGQNGFKKGLFCLTIIE